jgi:aryl-alcohol dehydrogenase-like predicted oxidoreductase
MKYGKVPGIDKPVSRLVQGTMMLSTENEAEGFALLDTVYEQGCNTFDTAHVYCGGDSDRMLGRWMAARNNRDQVVVLGKCAHHNTDRKRVTPFDVTADLYDVLARMKTDYVDLFVLHRDDPSVPVGPIVEILNEHKQAGRIRAFGGSNWTTARIASANAYAAAHDLTPFSVSSPHFSLAEQIEAPWDDCMTITGAARAQEWEWYRETQFPLFCWSSLAGGFFSGRITRANQAEHAETLYLRCYGCEANFQRLERAEALAKQRGATLTQVALAYVLNQPLNLFSLVAAYTPEEFPGLTPALDVVLTPEELAWLNLED